ncbi:MAG: hypothetical protein LBR58_07925 [Propionibacteriaceae bacterium]|nr:hypothetical protein [Propionibacteriaceae bacterium]
MKDLREVANALSTAALDVRSWLEFYADVAEAAEKVGEEIRVVSARNCDLVVHGNVVQAPVDRIPKPNDSLKLLDPERYHELLPDYRKNKRQWESYNEQMTAWEITVAALQGAEKAMKQKSANLLECVMIPSVSEAFGMNYSLLREWHKKFSLLAGELENRATETTSAAAQNRLRRQAAKVRGRTPPSLSKAGSAAIRVLLVLWAIAEDHRNGEPIQQAAVSQTAAALSGAVAGAVVGSVVPVAGTTVGAVIGIIASTVVGTVVAVVVDNYVDSIYEGSFYRMPTAG